MKRKCWWPFATVRLSRPEGALGARGRPVVEYIVHLDWRTLNHKPYNYPMVEDSCCKYSVETPPGVPGDPLVTISRPNGPNHMVTCGQTHVAPSGQTPMVDLK